MKPSNITIFGRLILAFGALFLSGCGLIPIWLRSSADSAGEPKDMLEVPEIEIEAKIPEEGFENPDYSFILEIYRAGVSVGQDISYEQADQLEVLILGKDSHVYGIEKEGEQLVIVNSGDCEMQCDGNIGYEVTGDLSEQHCILTLNITQFPEITSCTSDCTSGVEFTWYTGAGEVYLEPLYTDFKALAQGYSRSENMGNMEWEAQYKLKNFSGLPFIKYCGKKDLP